MRHDLEKRFAHWGLASLVLGIVLTALLAGQFEAFERLSLWTRQHEQYEVDELFVGAIVGVLGLLVFAIRRSRALAREICRLELAVTEAKILRALEPVCEDCESAGELCGSCRALYEAPVPA